MRRTRASAASADPAVILRLLKPGDASWSAGAVSCARQKAKAGRSMEDAQSFGRVEFADGCEAVIALVADGHKGDHTAKRLAADIPGLVEELLRTAADTHKFSPSTLAPAIRHLVNDFDHRYVEERIRVLEAGGEKADPGSTLCLNVILARDGRAIGLVNVNCGDSRSVLYRCENDLMTPVFESVDHGAGNVKRVREMLLKKVGKLVKPKEGQSAVKDVGKAAIKNFLRTTESYLPPDNFRIARAGPPCAEAEALGLDGTSHMELTDSIGDVFFKLKPSVIRGEADSEVVDFDAGSSYLLVNATDGFWNMIKGDTPREQARRLGFWLSLRAEQDLADWAAFWGEHGNSETGKQDDDCSIQLMYMN